MWFYHHELEKTKGIDSGVGEGWDMFQTIRKKISHFFVFAANAHFLTRDATLQPLMDYQLRMKDEKSLAPQHCNRNISTPVFSETIAMEPNLFSYRMLWRKQNGVSFFIRHGSSSKASTDSYDTLLVYKRIERKERITFREWLIRVQTGVRGRKGFALNRFQD